MSPCDPETQRLAQRNTEQGALETGACLEHNRTAAMATSGGVTSKPGSLGVVL